MRVAWLALALSLGAGPLQAQGLPGLSQTGTQTPPQTAIQASGADPLAETLRRAAEAGVPVIVVDAAGKVVASTDPGVTGPAIKTGKSSDAMMGDSVLMKMQDQAATFRATLRERLDALPNSINEVAFILRATSPDGRIQTYVEAVVFTILLFILGRIAASQIYGKRIVRVYVVSRIRQAPQGYSEKMPFLVFRFVMGVIGTLFAMLVAYVVGYLIFGPVDDLSLQLTIAALYTGYFFWSVLADLWRMILSPFLSQYRIPRFSDADAKKLYRWAIYVALFDFAVVGFATWLSDFGLNYNLYAVVYGVLALVGMLANVALILFNRRAITGAILNGREPGAVSWIVRTLSVVWAPAVIAYVIFGWLELAFDLVLEQPTSIPLIAGAYGVFLSIIVVYGLINFVIERAFQRSRALSALRQASETGSRDGDTGPAAPPVARTLSTFEELARRVAGILAFVAGAYAMLRIWDSENMLLQESMVDRALDVVVIVFIGYIVYHAFRIWIDSKIAEETGDQPETELGDEGGVSSASRLATLLPLFRNFILIIVVVSIGLMALLELGINVSPLFAGAGVVGLAVGFGAQTLVRDIFSGAFFLIDDAFRKGEYIDIGSVKGTVEKISVRSFQLRHHLGALHTIPFGDIQVLTNYSRDWVIMKLPLRVTYDTDVEKVRKLIKKLGQDLLSDPVIGKTFIQPLKSQGVIEMQDSAMIIRVKFMTKPGDQWLVRKKVFEEIRELFEREGIKFAHREVTVRIADEKAKDLTPEQREKVTGAVQAALDDGAFDNMPMGGDDR
ncbi:MAG: mechanosensitive ion channel [Rhodobacteraceae bacterium]|nr:MAG: mechanosensitive ion channel [Paracoccaceae bacterium]